MVGMSFTPSWIFEFFESFFAELTGKQDANALRKNSVKLIN